jgi:acetoin utilization deacetylase AcuC-like enzyme
VYTFVYVCICIICALCNLQADPLASLSLQPEDFGRMSALLKEAFGSRIVFGLEGGYAVAETAQAIQQTLLPLLQ